MKFTVFSICHYRVFCLILDSETEGFGTLYLRVAREGVVVTVEDMGVGIPEAAKDKLFTPLFTTKSKGQGFGLAVVKRMTEALGGTVTFESQVGKGTKFIVRLPAPPKK